MSGLWTDEHPGDAHWTPDPDRTAPTAADVRRAWLLAAALVAALAITGLVERATW